MGSDETNPQRRSKKKKKKKRSHFGRRRRRQSDGNPEQIDKNIYTSDIYMREREGWEGKKILLELLFLVEEENEDTSRRGLGYE